MNKTAATILTILAIMVVAYIAMAANYKKKRGPVIVMGVNPIARSPTNTWTPSNLGVDSRMWTPTVLFRN